MEQEKMAEIYDRLHDTVYRAALTYCRNVQDAEDIMQDVFLIRFAHEEPFPDAEAEKAWMLRVTVNKCKDLFRHRRRHRTVPLEQVQDMPAKTAEESSVWGAMNLLSERDRTAIHLFYFEGYSTQEIAEIMHAGESAVRMRLSRARKRLKKLLGKEFKP